MKRLPFLAVLLWFALGTAPRTVAQVDAEEVRRLNATVETLVEGQESLRRQIQTLKEQLDQVRADNANLRQQLAGVGKDNVSRQELERVVEQLREVDSKRQSDAQFVQRQLKDIAEQVSQPIPVPKEPRTPKSTKTPEPKDSGEKATVGTGEGWEHEVKSGETLGTIIAAYNAQYQTKIRQADVLTANPKLKDPRKIFVGQKLFIPEVK